jgi:hypothetical protein
MVGPPATSEAEARWPRFGLVVVATTSRRDYLDQMIRPIMIATMVVVAWLYWDYSLHNFPTTTLVQSENQSWTRP